MTGWMYMLIKSNTKINTEIEAVIALKDLLFII